LNWRKGFNRVFVVAAIGWAVFVLVIYPWHKRREAYEWYAASLERCATTEVAGRVIDPNYPRCAQGAEMFLHAELDQYSLGTWLKDWRSRLEALGVVLVPPAVAYGLFRLGWLVLAWVIRGFRQASG